MEFAYICKANCKDGDSNIDQQTSCHTLLEILSVATNHYVTSMQLVVICNYLGLICNYKFGIV